MSTTSEPHMSAINDHGKPHNRVFIHGNKDEQKLKATIKLQDTGSSVKIITEQNWLEFTGQ